jgi:hypothetical protein
MAQILLHHQVKCFHKLRSKTKENNARLLDDYDLEMKRDNSDAYT